MFLMRHEFRCKCMCHALKGIYTFMHSISFKNSPTTYTGHDKAFLIGCLDDGFVPNQDRTGSVQVFRRALLFRSKTLDRYNLDHLIT